MSGNRPIWIGLATIILGFEIALWRLPFLGRILTSDPSIFAYISSRILRGEVLYRDILDNKTPFIYYTGAFFIRVFSDPALGYWFMETLFAFLTTAGIFFYISRILRPSLALAVASVGIVLGNVSIYHYFTPGFVEYPSTAFVTIAYLITLRSSRAWMHFLSGAAVFAAFSAQQISIIACLPILYWLWQRERLNLVAMQMAGFFVPLVGVAYWFQIHDALDELLYASFLYNVYYVKGNETTVYWFRIQPLLYLLVPIAFIATRWKKWRASDEARLVLLWLLASSASLVLTGARLYAHYFVILAPPITLLLAHALAPLNESGIRRMPRVAWIWIVLFVAVLAYSSQSYFERISARLESESAHEFENPYSPLAGFMNDYPFRHESRTVLYLGIFNPTEPALLFSTRLPGRNTLDYTYFEVDHPRRDAMRNDWVHSVLASRPELIVVRRGFDIDNRLPREMAEWIVRHYAPYQALGDFVVMKWGNASERADNM